MMKSTYTILKTLNTLLENKETYSAEDYKSRLLELKDEIDQLLFMESDKEITKEEEKMLLQQYKILTKTI